MGRRLILLALAIAVSYSAIGQQLLSDSIPTRQSGLSRFATSPIGNAVIASAPLIALGQLAKHDDATYRNSLTTPLPAPTHSHDYKLQVLPAAVMLGMKALGVRGESTWSEMLVADAGALVLMSTAVEGLKHTTTEMRPDGSDEHSFPSGHTATAFMTATMLHHEYGADYPWLSVAGYGVATVTGYLRVYDHRHWMGDVLTGAGIGILSTELGYVLSDLIFHKPILKDVDYFRGSSYDPCLSFFSYYVSYDHVGKAIDAYGDTRFRISSGASIGLEGSWAVNPYVNIGGRANYTEYKYSADDVPQLQQIKYTAVMAGVYPTCPLSRRVSFGSKFQGGYGHYQSLRVADATGAYTWIDGRGGFAYTYGIWLNLRATQSLSYRIFADINSQPKLCADGDRIEAVSLGAQVAVNF